MRLSDSLNIGLNSVADTENTQALTPAPVADVVASAPIADTAPVVASIESTNSSVETAVPAQAAESAPAPKESFLGVPEETTDAPAADAKPVDEKPADVKGDETKPVEATADEATADETELANDGALTPYETFKGLDGQEATPEFMEKFTPILNKFQSATTPQERQAIAQQIVDMGAEAVRNAAQQVNDYYKNAYETRQQEWRDELLKDPVLGKNDPDFLKQSAQSMANFLAAKGGTKQEVADFRRVVSEAGVENSPALVRVLNNLKSRLDKYENESSRMLPGTKPAVAPSAAPGKGMINRLYGGGR